MDIQDKIKLTKENIWQAIKDYKAHTDQYRILDEISSSFVDNLAEDNTYAKQNLRDLFRKSPVWNEELDALIINGTRTHNPDYLRVESLAEEILSPVLEDADYETSQKIAKAISFFTQPKAKKEYRCEEIAAIQSLTPNAYAPNKKPSRIFKALCDELGISDNKAGSDFQQKYAQFADEISSRKIPFKLYLSLSAAHFFSMSNPKEDERGDMLLSCHSFNSEDDEYVCGCSGYARDNYSFIAFTATNPDVPETLNNRKNSRQIFAYKVGNGLLLQSRLYDANGGTRGAQEDSRLYRDLVQREISDLEGAVNLWETYNYVGNSFCEIRAGVGFGGYQDWTYKEFSPKISLRNDHKEDFTPFTVGKYGLCICCGNEISEGRYCRQCKDDEEDSKCEICGVTCGDESLYEVHDENGRTLYVCEYCRNQEYSSCDECDAYYPNDNMKDGLCPNCAAEAERDVA